jgi:RND family efflux transporter MFP subunit
MKTHAYFATVVFIAIGLAACGQSDEKPVAEPQPRAVRIQTISSRDLPIVVNSVGRLNPNREVVISAEVSGILTRYDVDVGSKVDRGEVLATLDDADYTLALKEAEANLQAARVRLPVEKNAFTRAQNLLPDKAITPELYDQAEAGYKAARALVEQLETTVAQARRRLGKTRISAPFSGHVTHRFVELGQHVAVGDPVMQVADMKSMRVKIYINELDYVHVDKEDPVTVMVEAFSQTPVAGRVDKIGIQADARTNTFEIEILVDNPDFALKAGLTARVDIRTDVIPGAVMIPQASVLFRETRKEVFVIDENDSAVVREVKLGRMDGSLVRVLEGVMSGDKLVVAGGQYLKPGDRVKVTQ